MKTLLKLMVGMIVVLPALAQYPGVGKTNAVLGMNLNGYQQAWRTLLGSNVTITLLGNTGMLFTATGGGSSTGAVNSVKLLAGPGISLGSNGLGGDVVITITNTLTGSFLTVSNVAQLSASNALQVASNVFGTIAALNTVSNTAQLASSNALAVATNAFDAAGAAAAAWLSNSNANNGTTNKLAGTIAALNTVSNTAGLAASNALQIASNTFGTITALNAVSNTATLSASNALQVASNTFGTIPALNSVSNTAQLAASNALAVVTNIGFALQINLTSVSNVAQNASSNALNTATNVFGTIAALNSVSNTAQLSTSNALATASNVFGTVAALNTVSNVAQNAASNALAVATNAFGSIPALNTVSNTAQLSASNALAVGSNVFGTIVALNTASNTAQNAASNALQVATNAFDASGSASAVWLSNSNANWQTTNKLGPLLGQAVTNNQNQISGNTLTATNAFVLGDASTPFVWSFLSGASSTFALTYTNFTGAINVMTYTDAGGTSPMLDITNLTVGGFPVAIANGSYVRTPNGSATNLSIKGGSIDGDSVVNGGIVKGNTVIATNKFQGWGDGLTNAFGHKYADELLAATNLVILSNAFGFVSNGTLYVGAQVNLTNAYGNLTGPLYIWGTSDHTNGMFVDSTGETKSNALGFVRNFGGNVTASGTNGANYGVISNTLSVQNSLLASNAFFTNGISFSWTNAIATNYVVDFLCPEVVIKPSNSVGFIWSTNRSVTNAQSARVTIFNTNNVAITVTFNASWVSVLGQGVCTINASNWGMFYFDNVGGNQETNVFYTWGNSNISNALLPSNVVTNQTTVAFTNSSAVVSLAGLVSGGWFTNGNYRSLLKVNYYLTDSTISGMPIILFTNKTTGAGDIQADSFVLTASRTNTIILPLGPNEAILATNISTGSASAGVINSTNMIW